MRLFFRCFVAVTAADQQLFEHVTKHDEHDEDNHAQIGHRSKNHNHDETFKHLYTIFLGEFFSNDEHFLRYA